MYDNEALYGILDKFFPENSSLNNVNYLIA